MSNNKKIYYINKRDNLIYDIEEAEEYIEKTFKNTVFLFDVFFNNYFIPLTVEKEEEILSKKVDKKY